MNVYIYDIYMVFWKRIGRNMHSIPGMETGSMERVVWKQGYGNRESFEFFASLKIGLGIRYSEGLGSKRYGNVLCFLGMETSM